MCVDSYAGAAWSCRPRDGNRCPPGIRVVSPAAALTVAERDREELALGGLGLLALALASAALLVLVLRTHPEGLRR